MKILILNGSPRPNGNTSAMVEAFAEGAKENGHQIDIINVCQKKIAGCLGCDYCRRKDSGHERQCVQKDDMEKFRGMILDADMVVFVTPLYYYGMSAQLKTLIDRFCAFNSSIQNKHMKSAMLAAAWNSDNWTFEALEAHYQTLVRYLNLRDMGAVWGRGCGSPSMTKHSRYPQQAYELGRNLK